jgi:hypothetical protein
MAIRKGGKKKGLSVDFSGVESGGKAVPDGAYEVEVVEVTEEEGADSGNPYLKWKFRITEGDSKGAALYDNTSLQPQALWRLKGLLEVLGVEVPDSSMELDLAEYTGQTLTVTVVNEEFQGRDRPKVDSYGGDADKSSRSGKTTKKKTPTKDDDDDDDDDDEFKKGDLVQFEDEGKKLKGKVVSVDGDTATVETSDGEEWEIEASDLKKL